MSEVVSINTSKNVQGSGRKNHWFVDLVLEMREKHIGLLGYLPPENLVDVLQNVLDYLNDASPEKSQHAVIKKFVRQTDIFVDRLFWDEIHRPQNKREEKVYRNDYEKWSKEYIPRRREKYRKFLQNGGKVHMRNIMEAVQHLSLMYGPYIGLSFWADHIDLVESKWVKKEWQRSSEDWLFLGFKWSDNLSEWIDEQIKQHVISETEEKQATA